MAANTGPEQGPALRGRTGLPPGDQYRRGDAAAAAAVAVLLLHLLFAQVTLIMAVVFAMTSGFSRWRPLWLAWPAGVGLVWSCAIGPGRALAGFAAGPRQVAGYFAAAAGHPAGLAHLSLAYRGAVSWLPGQVPVALIAAAGEALLAAWVRRRRTGEPAQYRPGLVVAVRRRQAARATAAGDTLTATGACVGTDPATGRRVSVTWRQAAHGVLCTGPDPAGPARTALALATAAIARRTAVIVIDLDGSAGAGRAGGSLAAACAAAGAPLRCFGPGGPGWYEPMRGARPQRAARLAAAMIDWSGTGESRRQTATAYLADACAVLAAAPAPRTPVLDDLAALLAPGELQARAAALPDYRGQALPGRASTAAQRLAADPGALAGPARQLDRLRESALGAWMAPPGAARGEPAPGSISLSRTLRDRAVVTFALDQRVHGPAARSAGALVLADLADLLGELAAMDVTTDCLALVSGCEVLDAGLLAELAELGRRTGTTVLLSTSSGATAAELATAVAVLAVHGPAAPVLAAAVPELAGPPPRPGGQSWPSGPGGSGPGLTVLVRRSGGILRLACDPGPDIPGDDGQPQVAWSPRRRESA